MNVNMRTYMDECYNNEARLEVLPSPAFPHMITHIFALIPLLINEHFR